MVLHKSSDRGFEDLDLAFEHDLSETDSQSLAQSFLLSLLNDIFEKLHSSARITCLDR